MDTHSLPLDTHQPTEMKSKKGYSEPVEEGVREKAHLYTQSPPPPIILCLSHLNWDYVWQRPQHILSRLARRYPVLYVSEPELNDSLTGQPYLKLVANQDNVSAWQPIFPNTQAVMDQWRELYVGLVQELLRRQEWRSPNGASEQSRRRLILWFYTPLPFYCLGRIPADLVVYDVMDELANFKNAAGDLRQREAKVLAAADVVFTGGRSLYQARRDRHPNVHLFPSGVEPEHFARALDPGSDIAADIAHLPRPILGYTGVIDERIDLELLRSLAVEHPEWSIVMVGPVAKIEATELPRLPNILYCGHQPYERLPNFLKGFDVCLMPFAINEATRSISPTKTLEYMAAHKPIVSTPVADVVANWDDVVAIAGNPAEFAAAIAAALDESESQRAQRRAREQAHLAPNTWDHIAAEMQTIIETSLAQPVAGRRACAEPGPESTLSPRREEVSPVDF